MIQTAKSKTLNGKISEGLPLHFIYFQFISEISLIVYCPTQLTAFVIVLLTYIFPHALLIFLQVLIRLYSLPLN